MRSTEPVGTGDMLCQLCGMYSSGPWYAISGNLICKICYDEGKCKPLRGVDLSAVFTRDLVEELKTRPEVTVYPKWATSEEVYGNGISRCGVYTFIRIEDNYVAGD